MSDNDANSLAKAHRAICSIPIKPAPRKHSRGISLDDCDGSHYERDEQDRIARLNGECQLPTAKYGFDYDGPSLHGVAHG